MIKKGVSFCILGCLLCSFIFKSEAQEAPGFLSKRTKASVGPVARFYWNDLELNGIYGLSFSPQFNLINNFSDVSLSLDLEPVIGYHPGNDADPVSFIYAGSPATLNLNIGHLATKDFRSDMGIFFGGGYSADYIRDTLMLGPVATTGLRWWMAGRSFTIRYHIYFTEQDDLNFAHSIGIFYNFGPWIQLNRRNNKLSKFARPFRKDLN